MKHYRFYVTLCLIPFIHCFSTAQSYLFSVTQAPYQALQGGTAAVAGVWDDPVFEAPIGFTFSLFGNDITSVKAADFLLGGTVAESVTETPASVIGVYGADLIDRGYVINSAMSPISYKTEGQAGQRVFTLQWENAGFFNGEIVENVFVDYISFQLKLYEATGTIEYHFGPSSITQPTLDYGGLSGPTVGLIKKLDLILGLDAEEALLLTGNPVNPTVVETLTPVNLNGSIPPNTLYRFTNTNVSATRENLSPQIISCYPNPTKGKIHLMAPSDEVHFPITVINSQGQLVKVIQQADELSLDGLPGGLYTLQFKTNDLLRYGRVLLTD